MVTTKKQIESYSEELVVAAGQRVKERNYWINKLSGFSDDWKKSCFPVDNKKTSSGEFHLETHKYTFSMNMVNTLMRLSKGSNDLLHMILLSGIVALLNKYTGNKDIIVGTPIYDQGSEGDFINTVLAIRLVLRDNMTFKELLVQTRQSIIEADEHANYPIQLLIPQLRLTENRSPREDDFPFFDTAVLLENIHQKRDIGHLPLNILFCFGRTAEKIEASVEYNGLLYDKNYIEQIMKHLGYLLEITFPNSELRLSGLDILTEEEKILLLESFNDTQTGYPRDKTIPQLFKEQVVKTPGKAALVFEDTTVTYLELNRQSDGLARVLIKRGVGPDSIVGLLMERCLEMMIGIMGILKAGGAYLPIDTAFPGERAAFMLEDCRASVLLTRTQDVEKYAFTGLQNLQSLKSAPEFTSPRPQFTDFDSLPLPDRSMVNYEKYTQYIGQGMVRNSITLQATRGCPYQCAYCCRVWPKKYVTRTARNIFEEVRLYYNLGIRRFVFIDDIFNLNIPNSKEFFQLIIDNGLKVRILFPSGLRGDILTGEYIDLMVEAGTISFPLALETASPRLQKLIRKNLDIEKLRENLAYIIDRHPQVILELHTMHGFPTETEEEAMQTLDFIKSLKTIHFPYIHILKIFSNTGMERLALDNGIPRGAIARSENLAYHQLPETLPFDKSFTLRYQADFLNNYFLSRERLLRVLPYQMKILSEDEIVQKYNSYLPVDITGFEDLMEFTGISPNELGVESCIEEKILTIPDLNREIQEHFPVKKPGKNALKVLLLDLSQLFSSGNHELYDVVEQPLGLMYLMAYLIQQFGNSISGKIAKSRIDFDNYVELKELLKEFRPDIIGLRTLTIYKNFFHKTAALIRHWGFDCPIIAGGPYATTDTRTLLQDGNIDLAVLGEGEITFAEIIRNVMNSNGKLPNPGVLREIAGIAFVPREALRPQTAAGGVEILMLNALDIQADLPTPGEPGKGLEPGNNPDSLAYVMFTSGSTGRPKGIFTTHSNVVRVVKNTNYINLTGKDRILQLSNYAFDGSVFDIYGALLNGAELVMIKRENLLMADRLSEVIKRENISVFFVTTAMFNTLVDIGLESLKHVRKVLFGGERVSVEHVRKAFQYMGKNRIIHMYGPTETTVYATYYDIDEIPVNIGTIPIGKPLANTSIYVLDKKQHLVPIGVPGEIYVGGDGLARGYLNNPELTNSRFRISGKRENTSPCSSYFSSYSKYLPISIYSPIYKTGDLGRWLPGGDIEFLNRIDQQVKIRGFRIEPGEIENLLMNHPHIKEAVLLTPKDQKGDQYLCAYIVADQELPASELKEFLSADLPGYMIPSYFVPIEKIPLNPNGKIDWKVLPAPVMETRENYAVPRDKIEKTLASIWGEVLLGQEALSASGYPDMSIDADFFEMGGHSLKATLLLAKIHKEFNVSIPLTQIFTNPTIRGLATYLKQAAKKEYISIKPSEMKEYYVLSSPQQRLYVLQQMDEHETGMGTAYNIPAVWMLEGDVNKKRLQKTFKKLINRHESLQTSFHLVKNEPVQKINHDPGFELEYFNLTAHGAECPGNENDILHISNLTDREETGGYNSSQNRIIQQFIRPFNLSRAPLLRVRLIEMEPGKFILLVDMHHIISDGTSMGIFVKDFMALYKGEELSIPGLQYKEFAEWQHNRQVIKSLKSQEKYWSDQFKGEVPQLNLPTDYMRPAVQNFAGNTVEYEINFEDTRILKIYAQEKGTTLYMLLLAIFNVLLAKITGQESILVGTVVAARRHADLEPIIGMFVNTLGLINYPQNHIYFHEFLENVNERILEAFENQDYPFEELVEQAGMTRDTSRNPLFDVMFVFQNFEIKDIEIPGLKLTSREYENRTSKFDLTLNGVEKQEGLHFIVEYCTALFKETTILRFISFFNAIILFLVKNHQEFIKISDMEILSREEKQGLLETFNRTDVKYPEGKTLAELFEKQVANTPDNAALSGCTIEWEHGDDVTITYKELNEKSGQLAYLLRKKGVGPDTIVALLINRSIEMIIGIMAVLKSGGAYLPMDPEYPEDRLQYMINDSSVKFLVTTPGLSERFKKMSIVNCQLLMVNEKPSGCPTLNIPPQEANLAYIIYTSGTTGKPKGVMIKHKNVVRLMFNHQFQFDFNDKDIWTMFHSYCFDFSVWELYGAILYGGQLVLVPQMTAREPAGYLELLKTKGVTVLNQTPSAFYHLMNEELQIPGKQLNLRYIIFGGEALKPGKLKEWKTRYPGARLINMFGITETTVHVTYKEITSQEIESGASNIGKPIPTLITYVVDRNLDLVPIGVAGELCVGGKGVGRGYLNRPEMTSEKFIKKIKNKVPGKIFHSIYKSGDRVRILADKDNDLEYLGRIDHQVKIRGFRIEPGEIENQLLKHTNIKETIVVMKKNESRENYLCAYIVSNNQLVVSELRDFLSKNLPDYMIPSYFIQLEKIPLTGNGKVELNALPEPEGKAAIDNYISPRTGIEKKLADIWAEVLECTNITIGIDDNFFDLGGHSLKAALLTSHILRQFNVKIPLVEVFRTPTIRALAAIVKESVEDKSVFIKPVEKKEFYTLSSAQRRLYILYRLEERGIAYNMPTLWILEGDVNKKRLEDTFHQLILSHECLRTSFQMIKNEPVQKIQTSWEFEVEYYQAGGGGEEAAVISKLSSGFVRPFDISRAPLLRGGLIELENSKYLLMADMHHIISDGISMGLLVKDFLSMYVKGKATSPISPYTYKDFAHWQNNQKNSEKLKQQEVFWVKEFSGDIPVLDLPLDYTRPLAQSFEGHILEFDPGKEKVHALKEIAAREGVTLFMLLLAIYNILLARVCGQEDIIIGIDTAGRHHPDLRHIIGVFVNTLALRNFPVPEKQFNLFLQEVKEKTLKAFDFQDYQFEDLVERIEVNRDPGRNPLFDVMFSFMDAADIGLDIQNITTQARGPFKIKPYPHERAAALFDLTLNCREDREGLYFSFQYCTKLFKEKTVKRFIAFFSQIVSSIIDDGSRVISGIEIISDAEKKQILRDFNNTKTPLVRDKNYIHLFESQAVKTPDKTAVVFDGHQVTYHRLNEEAERIAVVLHGKGATVNVVVALYLHRSIEILVGILGVFKCGGIYLPIETDYPGERVKVILEDSEAKILLTSPGFLEKVKFGGIGKNSEEQKEIIDIFNLPFSSPSSSLLSFSLSKFSPFDVAYIIYTSGSTGKPKGVMIHQLAMLNHLYAKINDLEINSEDIIAQTASVCFDISVWQFLSSLLVGGTTLIIPREIILEPVKFLKVLQRYRVTMLESVPSLMTIFIEAAARERNNILRHLRWMIATGETLKVPLVREWYRHYPCIKLVNAYGPTEAADDVTHYIIDEIPPDEHTSIPIGKPLQNLHIYILDKNLSLCPVGIKGEICVAGIGVGLGYWKDELKTGKSFLPNPLLPEIGDEDFVNLYRTGDIGYFKEDGNIECMGRSDHQVKIRGNRIELGEIESQLLNFDLISEAVVVNRADENGGDYLCAYIGMPQSRSIEEELKEYLRQTLPNYMVPSAYVIMDRLPVTSSGKVDRKALPEPEALPDKEYIAPGSDTEKKIAAVWQEVLKREKVGVNDNFFSIGGSSITIIQVNTRLREVFNREIPVVKLFEYTTIGTLANYLEQQQRENRTDESINELEDFTSYQDQSRNILDQTMQIIKNND